MHVLLQGWWEGRNGLLLEMMAVLKDANRVLVLPEEGPKVHDVSFVRGHGQADVMVRLRYVDLSARKVTFCSPGVGRRNVPEHG